MERVHGTATPERVLQVLGEQLEAGRVPPFRVDPDTGEPIIDLRAMEQAGLLHLVKKVGGVELHSSQEAAVILGRFLGMDKGAGTGELPARVVEIQKYVIALLEDPEMARQADRMAAKVAALQRGEKA